MTKTENAHLLSEEEKQQYQGLLTHAFNAASSFTGSQETYEHLMASLISMEEFVRGRNDDKMDEELEASFAKQTGFVNQQFYTISGLLGHASNQVYGMLARLADLKEVLNALSIGGAQIDYSEMVYVLTDEALNTDGEKSEKSIQEFIKQPRLAILVKELQTIGVYTDDLIIRVGRVFEDKIRKLPYVIVEIPRLGKQVAVCDQYGETTFVSQNILEPYIWGSYTKKQLKNLDGLQAVSYTEKWPFRVCNLLAYGGEEMTPTQSTSFPKVDIEEYERKRKKPRMELNEEIILNHVFVYLKKHQYWPSGADPKAIEGLPEERWQTWNGALVAGTRGLSKKSTLSQLIKNFIIGEAILYQEFHGFLPGQHAGPLITRPDITWELINKAYSGQRRGNLHTLYTSAGLIKKRKHKKGEPQRLSNLTPEIIMYHALAYLKENWRWPDEYMQEPVPGLSEEYWFAWDFNLWTGQRGLPGGSALYKTIWDWVTKAALQFQNEHKHLPDASSGQVVGYPDISWDIIDYGLRTQKGWKMPLEAMLKIQLEEEALWKHEIVEKANPKGFPPRKNTLN